jgi:hypothetical protein
MLSDKDRKWRNAQPDVSVEAGGTYNKRIAYICSVSAFGFLLFLYFVLFRDGFNSEYYAFAITALVVWMIMTMIALVWAIISLQRQTRSSSPNAPKGNTRSSDAR